MSTKPTKSYPNLIPTHRKTGEKKVAQKTVVLNPVHPEDDLDYEAAKKDYPLLTIKQRVFIEQFLRTGELKASAIAAGYKPKNASQIGGLQLRKPHIKNIIRCRQQLISGALNITREGLLIDLVNLKEKAMSEKRTIDAIKSIEAISKLLGYFDTRILNLEKTSEKPAHIVISTPEEKDNDNDSPKMSKKMDFDVPLSKEDKFYLGDSDLKEEEE